MKIQKVNFYPNYINLNSANIDKHSDYNCSKQSAYTTSPIDYDITFGARVDKGLTRFYEYNVERMPKTVKAYIEKLADKTLQTPLQAQAAAFAALAGLTSIAAIKEAYPEEDLFSDLKEAGDSKATRGILGTYRENKDLLEIDNRSVLANKEDLTVWLVKKIFLESKTLDEINEDFKQAVDSEFLNFYEDKELSDAPIRFSTLKALGIKQPETEYLQSLRYTRDGYSDFVGEKISEAQRLFWESMPVEERTARARKSVEKFENWWASLTQDQKLDMIAFQMDELEMLEKFNSSETGKVRKSRTYTPKEDKPYTPKTKTNVESELSRDELFKIWAGNNIKIFEANLTELDKRRIETKRLQHRIEAWHLMSPEEKTEYIDRLRSGSEELRYAIIQAWNENPDILVMLSKSLTRDHVEKPEEVLYGTENFNQFMSASMSAFWALHPDYAERFGDSIKAAYSRIKDAVASGRFEQVKYEITHNRANRIQETAEETKNYKEILSDDEYNNYPDYIKEFIDAYSNCADVRLKLLPTQYIKDFLKVVQKNLSQEVVESWTKHLHGEELAFEDKINLKLVEETETPESFSLNRAIEATFSEILYDCTGHCEVYLFSNAQSQLALAQISDGKKFITLEDPESKKTISIPVKTNTININKLNSLYEKFSIPFDSYDVDSIFERFLRIKPQEHLNMEDLQNILAALRAYIDLFGESCKIIFTDESLYPKDVRLAFLERFKNLMPDELKAVGVKILMDSPEAIIKEDKITQIDGLMRKKYSFLTGDMLRLYIYETNKILRGLDFHYLDQVERIARTRSKYAEIPPYTFSMNRANFFPVHIYYILCMEQALADVLYEVTGEEKFYSMRFEELADCIECLQNVNRFPYTIKDIHSERLNENFDAKIKKKVNTYKLNKITQEYTNELLKYLDEIKYKREKIDSKDLMYILNPYENRDAIDKYTHSRINDVSEFL